MGYIAKWGPMGFIVSPEQIVPLETFATSVSVKSDSGDDVNGTSATNVRGLEPQTINFSTKYMRAAGVDPRLKFEAWTEQVGKAYPLYIGNKRFGPPKMMLSKVEMSDLLTNNNGQFLSFKLTITLEEYSEGASSATASSATASKAADTYAKTVEKKKALNTTASNSDRSLKKVTGTEIMPTTF